MPWKFELLKKPIGIPITEGPVWDGEHLYFTHIHANTIFRYDLRTNSISPWRTGLDRVNGLALDAHGRLFGCCQGGRSVMRFDPDGSNVVIAMIWP
jgi:gluconolactonase